ncbi:MAG TPA: PucR family transcriptional regulator [Streptosporangiaceae bacterium]|nr:PucR family transcriptional regulator [Streptosporangiaceae bacterium]
MPSTGVIKVEDLLRSPALQLRLVAGAAGVARRVAWAHVSELEDPTPWLSGAEMIMTTGMAIPRGAAGQRAYLTRLDDAGVACLALSEGLHVPPVTRELIAAADERQFPIVEVPIPVPFMAVAQEVSAAVQLDTGQRLNAQLQVFGAVRWLAGGTMSALEIFARLERLSGYSLYACTRQGGRLLDGIPLPPERYASLIPATATSPPTVPGGYVLPVSGPRGTAGYILAMERPDAAPGGVSVVQHIATVAALQLSMLAHEREMLRREGAEFLSEMLQGSLDRGAVRRRLAGSGFPDDDPLVLAIVRSADDRADYEAIADELAQAGFPHLILRQQDDLYVLSPDSPAARAALARLPSVLVGISRPFGAEAALLVARREALWAVARAAASGRKAVSYDDDQIGRWLTSDTADLRSLVADVLGAVISYDQTHAGDVLPTLRTWLERNRRTEEAARALHIHPNTLLYRVRRFEQISGRSLATTEGLAEVWLALRASTTGPEGRN